MEADGDYGLLSCEGMFWVDAARELHLDDPLGERENFSRLEGNQIGSGGASLKKEDMVVHGLCPARDEFFLVVCEQCQMLVKPQALDYHIDLRHRRGIGESHAAVLVPAVDDAMLVHKQVTRKRPVVKQCQSPAQEDGQKLSCRRPKSRRSRLRGRQRVAVMQNQFTSLKETKSCTIGTLSPDTANGNSKSVVVDCEVVDDWEIVKNGINLAPPTRLRLHATATTTSRPNCRSFVIFQNEFSGRSDVSFSTANGLETGSILVSASRAGTVQLRVQNPGEGVGKGKIALAKHNRIVKKEALSSSATSLSEVGKCETEGSTEEPCGLFNDAAGDVVPSMRNNIRICLPMSFHSTGRKLSSQPAVLQNSLESSVTVAHSDLADHSERDCSVPLPSLPSSFGSICSFDSSSFVPAVHLEVLYTLGDSVHEETAVESSGAPDYFDDNLLRNICDASAEGISVQPTVLADFCSQLNSEAKINFDGESKCVERKDDVLGLEEQNLIVSSPEWNLKAREFNRRHLSSSEGVKLSSSHFAQTTSLSASHQDFDSGNQVATFVTADSLETFHCHRTTFPVWTTCLVEPPPNSTVFSTVTRSVESSQDQSADLVVSDNGDVDLSSFSTVLPSNDSSLDVPRGAIQNDQMEYLSDLISAENVPTVSHSVSRVGPVPPGASAVSHFSNKFHIAAATPAHQLSVDAQVLTSAQVSYAKSWLCQVGANNS